MASTRVVLLPAGQILRRIPHNLRLSRLVLKQSDTAAQSNHSSQQWCYTQVRHLAVAPVGTASKTASKEASPPKDAPPSSADAKATTEGDGSKKEVKVKEPSEDKSKPSVAVKMVPTKVEKPKEPPKELPKVPMKVEFTEKFIPLTRSSVVRHLIQEKDFLTEEEIKKYEGFALALDSAVVNRYHGQLEELKSMFDPINPDKDTLKTRTWNRRERLDNEFWVVQKLAGIMEKANFQELPRTQVEAALAEHKAGEGVMVSVDVNRYDVLRFWALGREKPVTPIPMYIQLFNKLSGRPAVESPEFFKRVVVAVRLKRDDKLMLKAFKEVPVNALEQLLPDGKVVMSKFDRGILYTSGALAGGGVLAKAVAYMAHVPMDWTMVMTLVTGLFGFRWWTVYKNRRNAYLLQLSRMLYFKNVANNRGLLTLLVDRAEDELFKELLLTYSFLLTNRPPSAAAKESEEQKSTELGVMSQSLLEARIEDWVLKKTGSKIKFDATESLQLLTTYGIASQDLEKNLFVQPLVVARNNLPVTPQTLSPRQEDYDSVEAYEYEETADDYQADVKKRKKFGWF